MWSGALCSTKGRTPRRCHTAWSLLYRGLAAMFFYFIFFFPSQANGRRVAYIGVLLGLSCFKLNSWASTPPPLPATMSQTLTFLVEGGGHTVQWKLMAITCKNWLSCRCRSDLLTHRFGDIIIMLQVALKKLRFSEKMAAELCFIWRKFQTHMKHKMLYMIETTFWRYSIYIHRKHKFPN